MKAGDLVKWMQPDAIDYGLVLEMLGDHLGLDMVYIQWHVNPDYSGPYAINHNLLEVINESR